MRPLGVITLVIVLLGIFVAVLVRDKVGPGSKVSVTIVGKDGKNDTFELGRTVDGVTEMWVTDWNQFHKGLGYAHARGTFGLQISLQHFKTNRFDQCMPSFSFLI